MPVYEAAEKCGMPILFHTGNFRPCDMDPVWKRPVLKNMNPINLDRIARAFPKLNMIMAHLGTRIFQDEASQYIKILPNLYADLGGCGQWKRIQPRELMEMMSSSIAMIDTEMDVYRKIILGSDAYVTYPHIVTEGHKHYHALLDRIGVPENIIRDVLGGTAAKWLGIELEK
jgi:predicted TIM-barrel fold metal-dependent hydrolase